MDKHQIAQILDEIGTLLSIQGENPFKIRAYHNAARALENLDEDLATVVREKRLEEIPAIGAHTAEKITTLFETGALPYYEKLKKKTPEGLLELLDVPGLGAKKVKILHEKLKIRTREDLIRACNAGKIAKLKGFGEKTQEKILNGIARQKSYSRRMLFWTAHELAEPILEALRKQKSVKRAEVAGSLRRHLETVGDLDFLVSTERPSSVIDWFSKQSWVSSTIAKGPSKVSVRLKKGPQADLRVTTEEEFPFALLYFTGSKEHNIQMRQRALKRGLSLSEYGFEKTKASAKVPKNLHSEEEIFQAVGLGYIPPELREAAGEIEAAEKGTLPQLVEIRDIRGAFHCHTTESDGHNTLDEMVAAAQKLGWEYIGISDHSKSSFQANGMDEARLSQQLKRIEALNRSKKFSTHVFAGIECDILTSGKLDFPNSVLKELDFVIVSVHRSFQASEKAMTARIIKALENPYTTILGHPTGRLLLRREAYAVNLPKVIDAAIANGKVIELNAHPMRLDLDWRFWHKAAERGLMCSIDPDAHSTRELEFVKVGVGIARKGWLQKKNIITTFPLAEMRAFFSQKKS